MQQTTHIVHAKAQQQGWTQEEQSKSESEHYGKMMKKGTMEFDANV